MASQPGPGEVCDPDLANQITSSVLPQFRGRYTMQSELNHRIFPEAIWRAEALGAGWGLRRDLTMRYHLTHKGGNSLIVEPMQREAEPRCGDSYHNDVP